MIVTITEVYYIGDFAYIIGQIDGVNASSTVWKSAINQLPDISSQLVFITNSLINTLPVTGIVDPNLVGTIPIGDLGISLGLAHL